MLVGHDLAYVDATPRPAARCTCGWTSSPASSVDQAEARWRIHVAERQAAASSTRALDARHSAQQRSAELRVLRARVRARRDELAAERGRIRAALVRIRRSLRVHSSQPSELEVARTMAGVTVEELWLDYVALGGDLGRGEIADGLCGDTDLPMSDHDLLVVALNERFAAAGFGSPLDRWTDPPRTA